MRRPLGRRVILLLLTGLAGCALAPAPPAKPAESAAGPAAQPLAEPVAPAPAAAPAELPEPAVELSAPAAVVTVLVEPPRYAPPESLKKFRYAKPAAEKAVAPPAADPTPVELPTTTVATVRAMPDAPRYKLPESLSHWGSGRKVPLYVDPDAAPWQATPSEPRLQNAAVSCNYKDEGGVRGRAMLLVDNNRLTRFTARIEMPNGGVCQFDSKRMTQRPFEQGIALQAKDDECVVRMWEQKHRITIAAYSCHKQCSRGSFSYLWPIIMDTRVGTCY